MADLPSSNTTLMVDCSSMPQSDASLALLKARKGLAADDASVSTQDVANADGLSEGKHRSPNKYYEKCTNLHCDIRLYGRKNSN